jgi:large subunit ribosomal protein L22
VTENMVGHKLGEFVPTRVFRGHGQHVAEKTAAPGAPAPAAARPERRPEMEARAIQRYVRITPRKCGQVLELIRGRSVEQAQSTLEFTPKYGARIVQKVLKSAVANALQAGKVRIEDLIVKEAVAGAGPTLKRWLPRAQGRATPLLKRMSHVSVTVATRE